MPDSLYIGAILFVLFLIIAFLALQVWRGYTSAGRRRFTYTSPAAPNARDASSDLFRHLKHLVLLGQGFEAQLGSTPFYGPEGAGPPLAEGLRQLDQNGSRNVLDGVRASAANLTRVLGNAEKTIAESPPTYANYVAVYRGLAGSDRSLLSAAETYAMAAERLQRAAASRREASVAISDGAAAAWRREELAGAEEHLSRTLAKMSSQLRKIVGAVHCFGAALDLE
jgi:hypothetical protein